MQIDKWLKKDLEFIWHPYTQMKEAKKFPPILIERAEGIKLYDEQGNFYYDTISSWWCNVHGHNHPKIKKAIKKQLNSLEHVLLAGFTHRSAICLAERLISIAPKNLTKVFFSDNGSTAVEIALKMSFQYRKNLGEKKKKKFISLDRGYHGDTIGTMSVSGIDLFNKRFSSLFFSSFKIPSPYCYRCPVNKSQGNCLTECIKPMESLLKEKAPEITAIILEPLLMAAAGMIVYPQEYLKKAAALAKEYHVHLILDEVATGFGRTGKMFACEYVNGIEPDFMCLSKGVTAGYLPLGITLTTDKVYKTFSADYQENKTFYHGHTYTGNPLCCSAALASLEIFEEEKTLFKIKDTIPLFHRGLERFRGLPLVGDVRQLGLIGALELVKDKKTKRGFDFKERIGLEVYKRGLKRNLILRPLGNVVYLWLPLCTKRNELEDILDKTYQVIESL
ncbi:MAG: adenosylmethionine--8-amino-7-oxononanoate transaminase [Candidatus Omnitrophica bacterium]|nr:adenosylmethionine--8-amino-7-oxononanoate transaminase [Candidatus Omnitrophota bacterium]MBI5144814.1 adenosylmethionine--8-amino-7-oxononanoate transaminase [Candidatus Omnitrophota bacterium]